jgi:hypothetical protein
VLLQAPWRHRAMVPAGRYVLIARSGGASRRRLPVFSRGQFLGILSLDRVASSFS